PRAARRAAGPPPSTSAHHIPDRGSAIGACATPAGPAGRSTAGQPAPLAVAPDPRRSRTPRTRSRLVHALLDVDHDRPVAVVDDTEQAHPRASPPAAQTCAYGLRP